MPDGARTTIEEPAATISADFLTGSTETGLDRIRTRLLDLTSRNKLINFRHSSASSIRAVDVDIDSMFARLRDNEKVAFSPVPEPRLSQGDPPSAKEYAEKLGWNTSFDLPDSCENAEHLRTLHYQESLDTVSRKIAAAAKTAIEESGANMLHLVFGFLEWYESDTSNQLRLAPLIAVPVTIERPGERGRAVQTILEYSGEDIQTNISLLEKMRRDFGVEIPTLDDEDTPTAYFAKFAEILDLKKQWSVRPQITLSLLSFGKLLMYRDLDPKTWPATESIAKHPLVRELFEGSKSSEIGLAEEYSIDAPEMAQHVPGLIRDADSSQHSALVHALRGQNLVIEGPPGTGKSQTITNLIAAALARGKTVLFVSEKLAALEVVRSRLDDAGLGVFCLEVHSHKTKKGALLNEIAQRHALKGSFRHPRDLDQHLATVEDKKQNLTKYAALINKNIEPFDATVFEILWARDCCAQETLAHFDDLKRITLPNVGAYSRAEFAKVQQFLAVYAQHLSSILTRWQSLDCHPWSWIRRPLGFEEEERAIELTKQLLIHLRALLETFDKLEGQTGLDSPATPKKISRFREILSLLPDVNLPVLKGLLASTKTVDVRRKLKHFAGQVTSFRCALNSLAKSTTDPDALIESTTLHDLPTAAERLERCGFGDRSIDEIGSLLSTARGVSILVRQAASSFHALRSGMGLELNDTVTNGSLLLESIRVLGSAPFELLHLRHSVLEAERARPTLQLARQEVDALKNLESKLAEDFDLASIDGNITPDRISDMADVLEGASFWQRLFGAGYRNAVRTYDQFGRGKKASRSEMALAFRSLCEHRKRLQKFGSDTDYREVLGPHFKGIATAWDDLDVLMGWYEQVEVSLPEHQPQTEPLRRVLFMARPEHLKTIRAKADLLEQDRAALSDFVGLVTDLSRSLGIKYSEMLSKPMAEIHHDLENLTQQLDEALRSFERAAIKKDVVVQEISKIIAHASECRDLKIAIESLTDVRELLGGDFCDVATDIESIIQTVGFAEAVALANLPPRTVEWLLCPEYNIRLTNFRFWVQTAIDDSAQVSRISQDLALLTDSEMWSAYADTTWGAMREVAERAISNKEDIPGWNHFVRVRADAKSKGLSELTTLADAAKIKVDKLGPAFHFIFYNTLSRRIFAEHPELPQSSGMTQELLQKQFAEADKEAIRLYSERVAAMVDQRPVPTGNRSGPLSTWTEMSLIVHEINKQKRHIPIRQLIKRSANALVALKPCFMMGPLSVAQYLAPGRLKFDVVVMDEASQLRPEDAIGALARGGQIVVVGDPKQLPPTSFFQRVSMDDEEETCDELKAAVEEGESILDVASTLFQPVRRLRWHYRSRHHSLIAFSNQEFYQGDLIIFPSAYHDDPTLGVKYQPVHDGVYESSRNPREAAVVADAVLQHMRLHPDESLGIVTLNFEQRELLEEILDRRLREDAAAIAFQNRTQGGQESLFIKNLENVQGDERDVIFISTTYGPDARGNQFQRFGPINGPHGHRRLNVLFTRAKKRTVVFSSLDPDKIQTTATSPWGVRALKQYLVYARTGILKQPDGGSDQPTNDFERSVGSVLKQNGYEVVPQVGVAGFFIDLGVKHPAKPGTFLLGIECDGASYHSGRSARDRDRLRQEILQNLGWEIHRIWSTDWFKSRDNQVKRLLDRIRDLLQRDPDYKDRKQKESRAAAWEGECRQSTQIDGSNYLGSSFSQQAKHNRNDLLKRFVRDRLIELQRRGGFVIIGNSDRYMQFADTGELSSKQIYSEVGLGSDTSGRLLFSDNEIEILRSARFNFPNESTPNFHRSDRAEALDDIDSIAQQSAVILIRVVGLPPEVIPSIQTGFDT